MAYVIPNTSSGSALRALADRIAARWRRHLVYRRTYAELSALSSRELNDLGISRHAISRLAAEAARDAA